MARKNATAEAIDMLRTEVRTNIDLLREEMHTNIDLLREEVHTNAARSNVLMEDMRSQFKVVVEMVQSTRVDLIAHFDRRFTKIEERLDALEFAVRKNSEDIRQNSEDIEAMRVELRQLRADFDRREERARIDALEKRVDKLESIARE